MFQNFLFQQYEDKTKNIDQIAQWTLICKQKKITQKYANVYSTVKLLKNLINDFNKKSLKIQEQFRQNANIQNLNQQTQFHEKRIQDCEALSKSLYVLIEQKKEKLKNYQSQAKKLRQQLIIVKTENIKKIIKIQGLQNKENELKQKNKKTMLRKVNALKLQENRLMMKTVFNNKEEAIQLLKKQKGEATKLLWNKINQKLILQTLFIQSYKNMKQKLFRQQKKSNIYGLTGSLLFKLIKNDDEDRTQIQPYLKSKHKDSKLMIYDVLKKKYETQKKIQQENIINLSYQKFATFKSIQILGLIELKGGFKQFNRKTQESNPIQQKKRTKNIKQNRYMTYVKNVQQ